MHQMENSLLSLSANSVECIINEFRTLDEVSAKRFYSDILESVKQVILDAKIDCLKKLSQVLHGLNNYQHTDGIGYFNLVNLACKNKAVKVLEYIFSEKSQTLFNLSINLTGVNEKELFSAKDEFCHDAFYYAMRSNMTDLLSVLFNKWPSQYNEELDDLLSQSYKELKLRKVSLTMEMQLLVQSKILDLRFFRASAGKNSRTGNSWEQIKKRIEIVVRFIQTIKNEYWDQDPDDKFILVLEFIAKNIHVLKYLLKSTYDRLPWEEIEFCLVIFIRCCKNPSKSSLVYNCVLNKKQLLKHLFNFSVVLDSQHNKFETSNLIKLATKPEEERDSIIEKIIKNNSEFCKLYDDYEKVRDFCSLQIIKSYADLIEPSETTEKQRHLLVTRVLQVMGEHLKNTLDSPKLSTKTSNALLSSLSSNTREIITKLRDALSHDNNLFIRSEFEIKTHFLKNVLTDILRMKHLINEMLYTMRISLHKNMLRKVRLGQNKTRDTRDKDIRELYGVTESSIPNLYEEIIEAFSSTSFKGDIGHLEELVLCLEKNLNDKTMLEKSLFEQVRHLIQKEKAGFENLRQIFYMNASLNLKVYDSSQKYNREIKHVIQDLVDFCLELNTSEISLKNIEDIKKVLRNLLASVSVKAVKPENREIYNSIWNIFQFIDFQMGKVTWMKEYRDTMSEKKITINSTLSANLLTQKFLQLKEALSDFALSDRISIADFSAFEGNLGLRAKTEMIILDILCLLEKSCSRNPFFIDSGLPVVFGKNLRNHLAHGNNLINVCLEESSIQLLINAKNILAAEDILKKINILKTKDRKEMDKVIRCDCKKLENSIDHDLQIIGNQQKLFKALEDGNMKDVEECLKLGADVYGKDGNLLTCLHFAGKAPDYAAVKWIQDQGLDINAKDIAGQTVLHTAAKLNRIEIVRYLVEQKNMSLDVSDVSGKTPLHVAVENRSTETVKYILKFYINLAQKDEDGFTLLHTAAYSNDIDSAKVLLEKKTNISENKSHGGNTALYIAASNKNLKFVELLISEKASVRSRNDMGNTPLHIATSMEHLGIVKVLVEKGADVKAKNIDGDTPLKNAAEAGSFEIVEFLLERIDDINVSNYRQFTPLMAAAKYGHVSVTDLLLQKGALVNSKDVDGFTPLHFAARRGHYKTVELLLNHKAIVNFETNYKLTALHLSAHYGHKDVVRLLLKEGAEINAVDSTKSTPLHLAAAAGHTDVVDLLIDERADITLKNEIGSTALHLAALNASRGIIESLLKRGADIRASDANKVTPLYLLISKGLSDLLTPEGKDVYWSDSAGLTLLHLGATAGDQKLVEYCTESNCDINARSNSGLTALHLAAEGNHHKLVSFLLFKGAKIDAKDSEGFTPLLYAVLFSCKDALEVLYHNDPKTITADKVEALRLSVTNGRSDVGELLFQKYKFDIKKLPKDLLKLAVVYNRRRVVAILLERGFDVNGDTQPLHIAVSNKHHVMVEFLLANGANPMLLDEKNLTPLHIACEMGEAEMVEILLFQTAKIRIEPEVIFSAAELAVLHNQLEVVKFLLQKKFINVNAKGNCNNTFLHSAAFNGLLDVTRYLVEEGAEINARNNNNHKAVHIAAEKGFRDMVEFYINRSELEDESTALLLLAARKGDANICDLLLERIADVNEINSSDDTPMHFALLNNHKDVVCALLHYGAYYNAYQQTLEKLTKDNEAAFILRRVKKLFIAVRNNDPKAVETLLSEQSKSKYCLANAKCLRKETALHYASWKGYRGIVDILLKYDTNPNARTKTGVTPMHYAAMYSHFSVLKSLLSNGAIHNALSKTGKTPLNYAKDEKICDFLLSLEFHFTKVQNNDLSVIGNFEKKDESELKAIIRAKNQEGKTLIDVAHICGFNKTNELQTLFETRIVLNLNLLNESVFEERCIDGFSTYESALRRKVEIFGSNSQPALDVKEKLAVMYKTQGNFEEALHLFQEVHLMRKSSLGEHHRKTLSTKTCIAYALLKQGKKQEALDMLKAVDFIQKEKFKLHDLNVLLNKLRISEALYEMRKFDEALKIITEIEEICSKKKEQSRNFLSEKCHLKALIFKMQGKYPEALELFQNEYESRKKNLPPRHPDPLILRSNVAHVLHLQKKYDESLEVYREVLDILKSTLPEDHIVILDIEFCIGDVLSDQRMFVAALKIFLSLQQRIRAVGPKRKVMECNEDRIKRIKDLFLRCGSPYTYERIQKETREAEKKLPK